MGFFSNLSGNNKQLNSNDNIQYNNLPNQSPFASHRPIERDPRTMGTDVEDLIEKTKATWRGMRISDDGSRYIPIKNSVKMISETGAEQLLGLHQQILSIPNATTNLDEEKINMIVINYGDNLNELVCGQYRDLNIPKPYFDFIIDPLTNSSFMFLLKSLNDKQRMWENSSPLWRNNDPIGANTNTVNPNL